MGLQLRIGGVKLHRVKVQHPILLKLELNRAELRFPVQPQLLWRAYCAPYGLRYFPGPVSEAQAGSEATTPGPSLPGLSTDSQLPRRRQGGQQVAAIGGGEGTDLPGGGEALRLPGIAALLSEPSSQTRVCSYTPSAGPASGEDQKESEW